MNIKSNYPNGFKSGVAIRQVPVISLPSKQSNTYWVDANSPFATDNSYQRGTFNFPFATLKYAITQVKENNGDTIYVAANHVETITEAGQIDIDTSGLTVIFLGEGDSAGTIRFTTDVSASIRLGADSVTFINPRFVGGIDALASPIQINADNVKIINGVFISETDTDFINCILVFSVDNFVIDGFKYLPTNEGGSQKEIFIEFDEAITNSSLYNIDASGDFSVAQINSTADLTNLRLENIILKNTNATPKPGIDIGVNSTGFAKNLDIRIASGTDYVASLAKLNWDDNCLGYNVDGSGGERIGGSSIDSGSVVFITAVLPYTEILIAGHDISTVVTGQFLVEDCVFETGGTGLATTAEIYVGRNALPTYGAQYWLQRTSLVVGSGNASFDIKNSEVGIHTTLNSGETIHVAANADATAGSDVKVTVKLRSLVSGSFVEVV